jgi:hypothetical protein
MSDSQATKGGRYHHPRFQTKASSVRWARESPFTICPKFRVHLSLRNRQVDVRDRSHRHSLTVLRSATY